jgi:hypothetical protein
MRNINIIWTLAKRLWRMEPQIGAHRGARKKRSETARLTSREVPPVVRNTSREVAVAHRHVSDALWLLNRAANGCALNVPLCRAIEAVIAQLSNVLLDIESGHYGKRNGDWYEGKKTK